MAALLPLRSTQCPESDGRPISRTRRATSSAFTTKTQVPSDLLRACQDEADRRKVTAYRIIRAVFCLARPAKRSP